MQVTISTINDNGIAQIAAFLRENHKKGEMIAESKDMLRPWAADAEFQLGEGNPASIEIKTWDSVHGRTQELTVCDEGIDREPIEIDE